MSNADDRFIHSHAWKKKRAEYLKTAEPYCDECGRGPLKGLALQVDHVLPRSTHPDLALATSNLRVLCGGRDGCNQKKGSGSLIRHNWFNDQWISPERMNEIRLSPTI